MATIGVWLLDKYARLVPDGKDILPLPGAGGKKGGSWTVENIYLFAFRNNFKYELLTYLSSPVQKDSITLFA